MDMGIMEGGGIHPLSVTLESVELIFATYFTAYFDRLPLLEGRRGGGVKPFKDIFKYDNVL